MGRRWPRSWVTTWRDVVTTASSCGRCSCSSCGTTATSMERRQRPHIDAAVHDRRGSLELGPERDDRRLTRGRAGPEADTLGYGSDGKMAASPAMRTTPVAMRRLGVAFIAIDTIAATIRPTPSQAITISRAGRALPIRGSLATKAHGSHNGLTFPLT